MYREQRKPIPAYVKQFVWDMTHGACWYCGDILNPWGNFAIDHVEPLYRGGRNRIQNLVPCCHPCNSRKGRLSLGAWRQKYQYDYRYPSPVPRVFAYEQRPDWRENRLDQIERCRRVEYMSEASAQSEALSRKVDAEESDAHDAYLEHIEFMWEHQQDDDVRAPLTAYDVRKMFEGSESRGVHPAFRDSLLFGSGAR